MDRIGFAEEPFADCGIVNYTQVRRKDLITSCFWVYFIIFKCETGLYKMVNFQKGCIFQ